MSFSVAVYRPPQELLYSAPLGGDDAVHRYWATPSADLNLLMIGLVYERGLKVQGSEGLAQLQNELSVLQRWWVDAVPDGDEVTWEIDGRAVQVPVLADLTWRAERVQAAITLASAVDGYITLS